MTSDDSLYGPQRDPRQTAHAQEMKAVWIIQKTFSCSRSQAAQLVRDQQNQNARDRAPKNLNEGSHGTPLFGNVLRIVHGTPMVEVTKTQIVPRPQQPLLPPQLIGDGLPDAPGDHLYYGRKDAGWHVVTEEAPNNAFVYGRGALSWLTVLQDSPSNANTYARLAGAWVAIVSFPDVVAAGNYWRTNAGWVEDTVGDTGIDGKNYWRRDNTWVEDTVDEAPEDTTPYARQDKTWVSVVGFPEAPNDANNYWRHALGWTIDPIVEAPNDGAYYARHSLAWASFLPFPEAPNDASLYVRASLSWVNVNAYLVSAAVVDSTTTLTPGSSATASASFSSGTVHFSFGIPAGVDGSDPTDAHLNDLILALFDPADYALNPTSITTLGITVSNPPTQAEVQSIADKLDALITALKH